MSPIAQKVADPRTANIAVDALRILLSKTCREVAARCAFVATGALMIGTVVVPLPAQATSIIQVGHGTCGFVLCVDTAAGSLPNTTIVTTSNGSLVAGAEANANSIKAYMSNNAGGSATIKVGHSDQFTLFGPGGEITFTATIHVSGSRNPMDATTVTAGFMNPGFSAHLAPPGSVTGTSSVGDLNFDIDVTQSFIVTTGGVFDVAMGVSAFATLGGVIDFGSTLTLGFFDLPDGYYVASRDGFTGVGSLQPISNGVPEPATLALMGLGLAGIGYQRRKQIKAA